MSLIVTIRVQTVESCPGSPVHNSHKRLWEGIAGFGFRTLREQAIHSFNCEGFWVHTLQGYGASIELPTMRRRRERYRPAAGSQPADPRLFVELDRSTAQHRYGTSFSRWRRRCPHSCVRPPLCVDPRLSSQRPDCCHVSSAGLSRARHRSEPVRMRHGGKRGSG